MFYFTIFLSCKVENECETQSNSKASDATTTIQNTDQPNTSIASSKIIFLGVSFASCEPNGNNMISVTTENIDEHSETDMRPNTQSNTEALNPPPSTEDNNNSTDEGRYFLYVFVVVSYVAHFISLNKRDIYPCHFVYFVSVRLILYFMKEAMKRI